MNLSELIRHHKGDRSYDTLAEATEGALTSQRLQQMATTTPAGFPKPANVRAIARALRVRESEVVLAVAESLGLDVATDVSELSQVLAALASDLDEAEVDAIVRLVRTFKREEGEGYAGRPATTKPPATGPGNQPVLRPVSDLHVDEAARADPKIRRSTPREDE